MPDLFWVALLVVCGIAACVSGRWLVDQVIDSTQRRHGVDTLDVAPAEPYDGPIITPTGAREPGARVDMAALEAAASMPMVEIIEAAEWRAEHPGEPEPKILADLDPAAWTVTPPAIPQVGGERQPQVPRRAAPPPPKPSRGAATSARDASVQGLLSPGMVVLARADLENFRVRLIEEINGSRATVVIPNSMEWKPLPSPYADCQHEDAEHEDVMGFGSTEPIKVLVTACLRCDRAALAGEIERYADQMREISDEYDDVSRVMPADLAKHFQRLLDAASQAQLKLDRIDRQLNADAHVGLGWML